MTGRARIDLLVKPVAVVGLFATLMTLSCSRTTEEATDAAARGAELAQTACAMCHVAPAPDALTRREWSYLLPQMSWLLGRDVTFPEPADVPGDGLVGYEIDDLEAKHRFFEDRGLVSPVALLSADDWQAIYAYYMSGAPERITQPQTPGLSEDLPLFRSLSTDYREPRALTTLVKISESSGEIFVGNSAWCERDCPRSLSVLDAEGRRKFRMELRRDPIDVHVEGDDFYLTEIGAFFPNHAETDSPAGIIRISRDGPRIDGRRLIEGLPRIANTNVTDLDGDSDADIVVCAFGRGLMDVGHVSWLENREPEPYAEHVLFGLPGCVRSEVVDVDGDGRREILVLVAGAREGLFLLRPTNDTEYEVETVFEEHPAYGLTHLQLADFNDDGFPDVVTVNGDDTDGHPDNLPRSYHGVRIYLNREGRSFEEAFFHPMRGASMASVEDFDRDGDLDIALVSAYPDFSAPRPLSFLLLKNEGDLSFAPFTHPASYAGRWLTLDGGDVDGDGDADLVLGAFYSPVGLPTHKDDVRERLARMESTGPSILILENTTVR